MDDALLMGRFERLGDLFRDRERVLDRNRTVRDALRQIPAFDELRGTPFLMTPYRYDTLRNHNSAQQSATFRTAPGDEPLPRLTNRFVTPTANESRLEHPNYANRETALMLPIVVCSHCE